MASPPKSESIYYHPIPSQTDYIHHPQNYVLLPLYYHSDRRRDGRGRLIATVSILLLALVVYSIWPTNPALKIARLKLDHVRIHTLPPRIVVEISLALSVKIRNVNFYSMDYNAVHMWIGYRGKRLGHVASKGLRHVRARGSSYVDAVIVFDGTDVLYDVVHLVEDLAKGIVPFDTVTAVKGNLGFLFFQIPYQARVSCEVVINTNKKKIVHENCHTE